MRLPCFGIAKAFLIGYKEPTMENNSAVPSSESSPPVITTPPVVSRWWWVPAARWAGELVTVFVGVYAAFVLNNHNSHRHERQRREQMLDWAEKAYSEMLVQMDAEAAETRQQGQDFNRRIEAGETPALYAFDFRSDYNPGDFTSLLESGGFDLLEVETVHALRDVEGTLRQMVETLRHDQQLCDALIRPNLDKDPSFFYEVSAHRLRPVYAWYGKYFVSEAAFYALMHNELEKALVQLRAERVRNR